jgi:hypothetical protein
MELPSAGVQRPGPEREPRRTNETGPRFPYSSSGVPFGLQQGWTDRGKPRASRGNFAGHCASLPGADSPNPDATHLDATAQDGRGFFFRSQQGSGFARSRLHPHPEALRAEGGALVAVW